VIETHEHAGDFKEWLVRAGHLAATKRFEFLGIFMLDRSLAWRLKNRTVGYLG
jgi:hypothetical protein